MKAKIIFSSKLMRKFLESLHQGKAKDTSEDATIKCANKTISILEYGKNSFPVEYVIGFDNDFEFKTTKSKISKLINFLKMLDEQPITMMLDTDTGWIWIKEATL